MGNAHSVAQGGNTRRNARGTTRPEGRQCDIATKASTKRARILAGGRSGPEIPSRRKTGCAELYGQYRIGSERFTIVRVGDGLIVNRAYHDGVTYQAVKEAIATIDETEAIRAARPLGVDPGHAALLMALGWEQATRTPEWVESVRVHLMGKVFPSGDNHNAPDYYREVDAERETLALALGDAYWQDWWLRNGNNVSIP